MKNTEKPMVYLAVIFIALLFVNLFSVSCMRGGHGSPVGTFSVTGKAQSGKIGFIILPSCSSNLVQGWNLVSLCGNSTNTSFQHVFSQIDGDYRFIMLWNESSQEFIVYSPKSSSNPFDTISMGEGQFININNPSGALLVYNKTGLT